MLPTRRHLLRSLADRAYDGTEHPAYTTSVYAVDRPGLPHPASVVRRWQFALRRDGAGVHTAEVRFHRGCGALEAVARNGGCRRKSSIPNGRISSFYGCGLVLSRPISMWPGAINRIRGAAN
jgi:hypothetical protein